MMAALIPSARRIVTRPHPARVDGRSATPGRRRRQVLAARLRPTGPAGGAVGPPRGPADGGPDRPGGGPRPSAVILWGMTCFRVVYHAGEPAEALPPDASAIPEDGGPGTYWFVPDPLATIAGPGPARGPETTRRGTTGPRPTRGPGPLPTAAGSPILPAETMPPGRETPDVDPSRLRVREGLLGRARSGRRVVPVPGVRRGCPGPRGPAATGTDRDPTPAATGTVDARHARVP